MSTRRVKPNPSAFRRAADVALAADAQQRLNARRAGAAVSVPTNERITMSRQTKAPASRPAKAPSARSREAQAAVEAALSEGKLTDTSLPAWRAAYERDPQQVRAELRQLAAPAIYNPSMGRAAAAESDLLWKTRGRLGLASAASSAAEIADRYPDVSAHLLGGASVPYTPRPAVLTRSRHGTVLWGGVPTRSDQGTTQVYYFGWVALEEAERRGITPDASALAIHAAQSGAVGAEARAELEAGLPAGSALGAV
jgi:hypothetical protein